MMEIYSWQLSLSDGFDWTPYFYYLFNRNSSNSLHFFFCFCFSSPLSLCSGTKLDTSWVTHMGGLFVGCVTHNFWCGGGEHGCIATNHSHVVSHNQPMPPPPYPPSYHPFYFPYGHFTFTFVPWGLCWLQDKFAILISQSFGPLTWKIIDLIN